MRRGGHQAKEGHDRTGTWSLGVEAIGEFVPGSRAEDNAEQESSVCGLFGAVQAVVAAATGGT